MFTAAFLAFLLFASAVAFVDWRRGFYLALVAGVLQDPVRKMTPGTPPELTMSIVVVYLAVLIAAQVQLRRNAREMVLRFSRMQAAFITFTFALLLAALNGIYTYGISLWRVPALSLLIYTLPLPAVVLGYMFIQREEQLTKLFTFYSIMTAIALIGTPLEYFHIHSPIIGLVAQPEGYMRFLPGMMLPVLSGFYRAPDIMAWHASMLTIVGITMAIRARVLTRAWPWLLFAAWGLLNCLISGRRKSVYMVVVFAAAFLWRYGRRLEMRVLVSFALFGLMIVGVVYRLASKEESTLYTKATETSRSEVLYRLEGGATDAIVNFGFMGAGLGTATQGVRHILGHDENIGWQEGGLGKLAVELGLPGLLASAYLLLVMYRVAMIITAQPDLPGTTQLIRASLFGIAMANFVTFIASAQAYSDPVLALFSAFLVGCLLGTAALDERHAAAQTVVAPRLTAQATA
jgi:hypothetical protein